MTIDSGDPGCLRALQQAVGHPPPFTVDELRRVEALIVQGAQDLSIIEQCKGLTSLRVVGSELESDYSFTELPNLRHLELHATLVRSFETMSMCDNLERLELLFTSAETADFLYGLPSWKRAVLQGNPWIERTRGFLIEESMLPETIVDLCYSGDWETSRTLWERAGATCGMVGGHRSLVVRPGLPRFTSNAFDALALQSETVDRALESDDFSLGGLFQRRADRVVAPDLGALVARRTVGHAEDARRWIAGSTLDGDDKAALGRFVERFPQLVYYRMDESASDPSEENEVTLPASYRELQRTLASWFPHLLPYQSPVQLRAFEGYTPQADRLASTSYMLGIRGYPSDEEAALKAGGFIIIGLSQEHPQSTLALRAGDGRIYEYSEESLIDAMLDKKPIEEVMHPVFRSYAAMLDQVVAVLPQDLEPIHAL